MDNRTIILVHDDFILDLEAVGDYVTKVCNSKQHHFQVRGVSSLSNRVIFMLENASIDDCFYRYVVDEFGSLTDREVIEIINSRWQGGYATIAIFKIHESYFGVFEQKNKK